MRLLTGLFSLLFLLSACTLEADNVDSDATDSVPADEVVLERVETEEETFRLVRVVDGLEHPWGMDWLPDGRMLITERPGRLNLYDGEGLTPVSGLPEIEAEGQGGLLDVKLHPDFDDNGWVYFTYSASNENGMGTVLARAHLDDATLTNLETLYEQTPFVGSGRHFGSRIVFPDDGTVVFTIGERGQREPAQDLQNSIGTTIRLNDDGSIPDDNPFVDREDALPEIYSYGHRNQQGMAIHPETGAIWQHEHGPRGGDELNLVEPGNNYGWPEVTYGVEYRGGDEIGGTEAPGIEQPVIEWTPSIAPSGMTFYTGENFPNWQGQIFLGALAHQHVRRVVLDGGEVTHQEEILRDEIGRIRDVKEGPDGNIYLLVDDSNASLYRMEPAED